MKHKTVNQTISMIPLDQIEVIPGLNPRFNLPNMEEIISSIRENGIQEPLKVFLNPETGKYAIVKGHRRYTASLSIATSDDLDHSEIMIPCLKYGGVPEDEMILRDHIISNSGEPFTVLEKAEIIKRYKDLGFSITEISKQIGFTYQQTYNLEILSSAPSEIKQMISEGIVSSTLIFEEFKKKKSFDEILHRMKELLLQGAAKITSKNFKEIKEEDSELEEKTAENKASRSTTPAAPNEILLDQKLMLLIEEIKLQYNDRRPELNEKIDEFISIISLLQSGEELTTIVKAYFS